MTSFLKNNTTVNKITLKQVFTYKSTLYIQTLYSVCLMYRSCT